MISKNISEMAVAFLAPTNLEGTENFEDLLKVGYNK
jgi:hypothetical protein